MDKKHKSSSSNIIQEDKRLYSLSSLNNKLSKSESETFCNYYVDLNDIISESYDQE